MNPDNYRNQRNKERCYFCRFAVADKSANEVRKLYRNVNPDYKRNQRSEFDKKTVAQTTKRAPSQNNRKNNINKIHFIRIDGKDNGKEARDKKQETRPIQII